MKEYSENNMVNECDCAHSAFCYEPHGHVLTGNLNIIQNEQLRKLIGKGPKFREQNPINWSKNRKVIFDALDKYAKRWCNREHAENDCLNEWVKEIKNIVNKKIQKFSKRTFATPKKVLDDPDVKLYLESFQKKYVLVPADKASNNIIIVCKSYYISVIKDELGIRGSIEK